jgi:hypothetical protein
MSNVFEQIRSKWHNSPYIIYIFILALFIVISGLVLFFEDGKSSRDGFEQLEHVFGVEFGNWGITYWVIGFIPQVAQIFFMYLFLMDTKKNRWALGVVAMFFTIDFISDVQDRSGRQLFPVNGTTTSVPAIMIASAYTITFITIGSELFISAGIGVLLAIWPHALAQFGIQRDTYRQSRPRGNPVRSRRPASGGSNG